jgi:hypothetical protein
MYFAPSRLPEGRYRLKGDSMFEVVFRFARVVE